MTPLSDGPPSSSGEHESLFFEGPEPAIDRQSEAIEVARYIAAVKCGFIVLVGRHSSGKTALIRAWVIPALHDQHGLTVYKASCDPHFPQTVFGLEGEKELSDAAQQKSVVIVDDFDRCLRLPERQRDREVTLSLKKFEASSAEATLVLVVSDRNLGALFAFLNDVPTLTEHVLEIQCVSIEKSFDRLAELQTDDSLRYAPEVLERLRIEIEDLSEEQGAPGLGLFEVIDSWFRRRRSGEADPVMSLAEYTDLGGLQGALRGYLEEYIETLKREHGENIAEAARALLGDTLVASRDRTGVDLNSIASRIEVEHADVSEALGVLTAAGGLLQETEPGTFEVVPPILTSIIEDDLTREIDASRSSLFDLQNGLETWSQVGTVLPGDRFEAIHERRKSLRVSQKGTEFLAHCAVALPHVTLVAAGYWLRRICDLEARTTVLVDRILDEKGFVRARAAELLGQFGDPSISRQLYRCAVEDEDLKVRSAATTSLRLHDTDDLEDFVITEATAATNPYRINAIRALRAFPGSNTIETLTFLVRDRKSQLAIRDAAIHALAAMEIPESVDALVDTALSDEDAEDRERAASALAVPPSQELAAQTLARVREAKLGSGGRAKRLRLVGFLKCASSTFLATLIVVANLLFHGLLLFIQRRPRLAAAFFAVEVAAVAVALLFKGEPVEIGVFFTLIITWSGSTLVGARIVLRKRGALECRPGSFEGILAIVVFVYLTLPVFFALVEPVFALTETGDSVFGAVAFVVLLIPLFAIFHGLAHILVGKTRRGVTLIVLEALGVLCLFVVNWLFPLFHITVVPYPAHVSALFRTFYQTAGWSLIVGTYVFDVGCIAWCCLFFPRRTQERQRRFLLLEKIVQNPIIAGLLLDDVRDARGENARWARRIVQRFGRLIPPELLVAEFDQPTVTHLGVVKRSLQQSATDETCRLVRDLWNRSNHLVRQRLIGVLAAHPRKATKDWLRSIWRDLSWPGRLRYAIARCRSILAALPKGALFAVFLLLPIAVLLAYEGFKSSKNPARYQLKYVRSPEAVSRNVKKVIATADWLAAVYPERSAPDLIYVYEKTPDADLRIGLARSLSTVAVESPIRSAARESSIRVLSAAVLPSNGQVDPNDKSTDAALQGLTRIAEEAPDLTVVSELGRLASQSQDDRVQIAAIEALAASAQSASLGTVVRNAAIDKLRDLAIEVGRGRSPSPRRIPYQRTPDLHQPEVPEYLSTGLRAIELLREQRTPRSKQALERIAQTAHSNIIRSEAQKAASAMLSAQVIEETAAAGDLNDALRLGLWALEGNPATDERARILATLGRTSLRLSQQEQNRAPEREREAAQYLGEVKELGRLEPGDRQALALAQLAVADRVSAQGNITEALQWADKAIGTMSELGRAQTTRASALIALGRLDEAMTTLEKITAMNDPENYSWARCARAWIFNAEQAPESAERILDQVIRDDPAYSWSYALLWESLLQRLSAKDAAAILEDKLEQDPKNAALLREMVFVYHEILALDNPAAFERTFELQATLTNILEFENEFDPTQQAGFVESHFTTGRFARCIELGGQLLRETNDPTATIPTEFIVMAAELLRQEPEAAADHLDSLRRRLVDLPPGSDVPWSFAGTKEYLKGQELASTLKNPLMALLDGLEKNPVSVPEGIFEDIRKAIEAEQ